MLFRINLIGFIIFLLACKHVTENKGISEEPIESFLPTEFEEFYYKFHTDSIYQINHIVFPLEGKTYDEHNSPTNKLWTVDNWKLHKEFDDMDGTFTRSYTEFGGIICEKIVDNSNISNMERRFSKIQDEWHLIYYDPIHLLSN